MLADDSGAALPSLADVMPQQGSMILLDRVIDHDDVQGTRCSVDLAKQTWLRRKDSSIPVWVALEYMAQCIAAHEGYRAWHQGRKLDRGLFVGARRVHFHRADFQGTGELEVRARYLRGRAGLGALSYSCEIRRKGGEDDEVWVEGTLNVALPDPSADAAGEVES